MSQINTDPNWMQRKARDWAKLVVKLHNMQVPPQFEGEKQALLNFAKRIKNAVEGAIGTVPQLDPLNQLGALPIVIGIVGIAGAGAAITKWTIDYKKFVIKVQSRNALIADGVDPKAAAEIANAAETPSSLVGSTANIKNIAKIGALAFGGYLLAKRYGVI